MKRIIVSLFLSITGSFMLQAQQREVIYDEAKVPSFILPPLLINGEGEKVSTPEEWEKDCRPEILAVFADQVYGVTPEGKVNVTYEELSSRPDALSGMATCKQIKAVFSQGLIRREMLMLIYLPNQVKGKVPLFLSYNFSGNQTICEDPGIIPSHSWAPNNEGLGITNNTASEARRGTPDNRWPMEKILSAGYGLATIYYGDLFPDAPDKHRESVLRLYGYATEDDITSNSWQAMGAWAWGLSRAMDYFETDPEIDAAKVLLMGHSRQGKAALWAGAQDQRFAAVISNNSGCGGAALSKRRYGETIGIINSKFPHWFCRNFNQYADNEESLSFDQHELLALIAPRPLYVASAEDDRWADPKGEFLSACYVGEVYQLYGYEGLNITEMPPVNSPVMNRIGYHIRTGKHAVTDYDWEQYIRFADKWVK